MEFRVIALPPFRAACSGVDPAMDFSPEGVLGRFDSYFSNVPLEDRDRFSPRDFLFFDEARGGMVWWWALSDGMDDGGNPVEDFDGGYYLTYAYKDGDGDEHTRLYQKALAEIESSPIFELDIRPGHYVMGHIITPQPIVDAQGWAQMETFIPIRLKAPQ